MSLRPPAGRPGGETKERKGKEGVQMARRVSPLRAYGPHSRANTVSTVPLWLEPASETGVCVRCAQQQRGCPSKDASTQAGLGETLLVSPGGNPAPEWDFRSEGKTKGRSRGPRLAAGPLTRSSVPSLIRGPLREGKRGSPHSRPAMAIAVASAGRARRGSFLSHALCGTHAPSLRDAPYYGAEGRTWWR